MSSETLCQPFLVIYVHCVALTLFSQLAKSLVLAVFLSASHQFAQKKELQLERKMHYEEFLGELILDLVI